MKKKKTFKRNKSPYKITDKVRVRKSYYTFSEEYPADRFQISRRKKTLSKRRRMRIALSAVAFVLVLLTSYFVMSLSLNISSAPIDSSASESVLDTETTEKLKEKGIRALYMPSNKLSDKEYIKDLVYEIERKNGNCVVIDFKHADGKLSYTSFQNYAIMGRCNLLDNDTVRNAVNIFTDRGITVIARIFCFEDLAVSEAVPEIAVKYMDTDVNWRDTTTEEGNGWLNPVSRKARNYLYGIMEELYAMDIRGFMLESVQFPDGAKSGATYPGEKNTVGRNAVLKNFVSNVRRKLPKDALIIVAESLTDAVGGNENIYFGSMSDLDCHAISPDTRVRDESIVLSRKERFISLISLYSDVAKRFPEKMIIPVIHSEEYSRYYIYTMKRNGFNSFILIDENGNY